MLHQEAVDIETLELLKKQTQLNHLSPHLFWDVDSTKLDISNIRKLIIQRVLDYGLISDWEVLLNTRTEEYREKPYL